MAHRLEEAPRTVTWSASRDIVIGYRDCQLCGVETPTPTMDQLVAFARECEDLYYWPFPDVYAYGHPDNRKFAPIGWSHDSGIGNLCPACTVILADAKAGAIARCKKGTP